MKNNTKILITFAALGSLAFAYTVIMPLEFNTPPPDPELKATGETIAEPAPAPALKKVVKAVPDNVSAAGNYLAGKHAKSIGELDRALDFYQHASQDNNIATADLYGQIYILGLTQGELDRAITALNHAEDLGGTAPLSKMARAVTALKAAKYDEVIRLFSKDNRGISSLLAPTILAWAHVGNGDTAQAFAALDTMKGDDKLQALRLLHTALILDVSGNPEQAGKAFETLQKFSGLSVRTTQLMGANLERRGLSSQALKLYQKTSSTVETDIILKQAKLRIAGNTRPLLDVNTPQKGMAEALYDYSKSWLTQGSWEGALALANMALHLRPDFPTAAIVSAAAMEQSQRIEEANAIYEKVPETSPLFWFSRQHMANNYDRLEQTDKAIEILNSLAKAYPNRERPLIELGNILRRHERFLDSIDAYTQALARIAEPNSQNWNVFYMRGISYEQTQQWPLAEADFLKALTLNPDEPRILNYLGYSWIDQGLHLKKALEMIRKAVELRPRDGYIVDSLGWGLFRLGDFKAAVKSMERATTLRPADALVNDHFGDALWRVGRLREARFQWQRALDMDPDPDLIDQLQEKLKNGLGAPDSVQ